MINKAITPREITELIRRQMEIDNIKLVLLDDLAEVLSETKPSSKQSTK